MEKKGDAARHRALRSRRRPLPHRHSRAFMAADPWVVGRRSFGTGGRPPIALERMVRVYFLQGKVSTPVTRPSHVCEAGVVTQDMG